MRRVWTEEQKAHRAAWAREYYKTHPMQVRPSRPYTRRSAPRAKTLLRRGRSLYEYGYAYGDGTCRQTSRRCVVAMAELSRSKRQLPATRAECEDGPRPCPYVTCKHHLYLDANSETGSIKLNFPHLEPWEMAESCSLDIAERGGSTLEDVGAAINLTRERVRQVEVRSLAKLQRMKVFPRGEE